MAIDLAPGTGPFTALTSAFVVSPEAVVTVYDVFETVAALAPAPATVDESYISALPVVNTGRP
jgi:hypothetical protein